MLYLKRRHVLYLFAVLLVAALAGPDLLARAGGGGDFSGGDNGGGGGDGWGVIIYLLIRVILELPFPLNVIVAGIIIAGFIIFTRVAKKKVKAQSILNKLPAGMK